MPHGSSRRDTGLGLFGGGGGGGCGAHSAKRIHTQTHGDLGERGERACVRSSPGKWNALCECELCAGSGGKFARKSMCAGDESHRKRFMVFMFGYMKILRARSRRRNACARAWFSGESSSGPEIRGKTREHGAEIVTDRLVFLTDSLNSEIVV